MLSWGAFLGVHNLDPQSPIFTKICGQVEESQPEMPCYFGASRTPGVCKPALDCEPVCDTPPHNAKPAFPGLCPSLVLSAILGVYVCTCLQCFQRTLASVATWRGKMPLQPCTKAITFVVSLLFLATLVAGCQGIDVNHDIGLP